MRFSYLVLVASMLLLLESNAMVNMLIQQGFRQALAL